MGVGGNVPLTVPSGEKVSELQSYDTLFIGSPWFHEISMQRPPAFHEISPQRPPVFHISWNLPATADKPPQSYLFIWYTYNIWAICHSVAITFRCIVPLRLQEFRAFSIRENGRQLSCFLRAALVKNIHRSISGTGLCFRFLIAYFLLGFVKLSCLIKSQFATHSRICKLEWFSYMYGLSYLPHKVVLPLVAS